MVKWVRWLWLLSLPLLATCGIETVNNDATATVVAVVPIAVSPSPTLVVVSATDAATTGLSFSHPHCSNYSATRDTIKPIIR